MQAHFALTFVYIQGFVHLLKQGVPILAILRHEYGAEADAELAGFYEQWELLCQLLLNLARQNTCFLLANIGQEDYEFIAAIAGDKLVSGKVSTSMSAKSAKVWSPD